MKNTKKDACKNAGLAKHLKAMALALCLVLTTCLSLVAPANCQAAGERQKALYLYHQVWKGINDQFMNTERLQEANWQELEHKHDAVIKTMDDSYVEIKSILAKLGDRYTRFLDPKETIEQNQMIQGGTGGIGVRLQKERGATYPQIKGVYHGSAAELCHVQPGDLITAVNGKSVADLSLNEIVQQIRGDEGTSIKMSFKRKDTQYNATLVRHSIDLCPIVVCHLEHNILYIRVSSFMGQDTAKKFHDILVANATRSTPVIIDLRENPGGLLSNALAMAACCVNPGSDLLIVRNRSQIGKSGAHINTENYDLVNPSPVPVEPGRVLPDVPVAILVNNGSASASEVFSGALLDNKVAFLVGEKTFGKGCVQGISTIGIDKNCELNTTIQYYFTPRDFWPGDGGSNKIGLSPDPSNTVGCKPEDLHLADGAVGENNHPDTKNDKQLIKAMSAIEAQMAGRSLTQNK